ncbi:uncharacterized protein FMAN_14320 [Fusarium mangiferae]|uniref:Uncharacterized protein n=1 Tax=Fusarium mangiferae TaxID=192010 RepID=A0A1L7UN97_FUSMA|nr:uncharacterized protein FMAN_14320 [Fusarium mangiferae]CVL09247.1 uncharacterized protein FMAN_14320 [Fusarium mangiferae]
MSARYFETVTSASAFDTQLKAELKHSGGPLSIGDLQASGSNWGRRQLLACRAIILPTAHNVLPAYEGHTQRIEEIQEIKEFLEGPDPALMHHSTRFLISEYGFSLGEMWAALAAVKHYPRPLPRNDGTPEAKRVRRHTVLEGYVSSAGFQVSSSDPEERTTSPGSDGICRPYLHRTTNNSRASRRRLCLASHHPSAAPLAVLHASSQLNIGSSNS